MTKGREKENKKGVHKRHHFLTDVSANIWPPPPRVGNILRGGGNLSWIPTFYKYFFRTCSQTGVTMQKNGFNKKKIGHAEYFLARVGSTATPHLKSMSPKNTASLNSFQ